MWIKLVEVHETLAGLKVKVCVCRAMTVTDHGSYCSITKLAKQTLCIVQRGEGFKDTKSIFPMKLVNKEQRT